MRFGVTTVVAAAATVLTGCFTSGADFVDDAERYIEEDEALRDELFPGEDTTFDEAACADPGSSAVGTTFTCTATDSAGDTWEFQVEITGRSGYEVNVSRFPAAG